MVNYRPEFCPYCGDELATTTHDGEEYLYCETGDRLVFHDPTPNARVVVVEGDSLLLIEQGSGATAGSWTTPGGHLELGEQPHVAAARELEEETGLAVDPDDLELFLARACEPKPGKHLVELNYAVARSDTSGPLEAGTDADDARFWTPEEFAASGASFRELHDEPSVGEDLEWWLREAWSAIE